MIAKRLARALPALLLVVVPSCAYFNGIYNARAEEKRADRLARRGEESAAREAYLAAAQKAETVLVRHRKSRWRDEALYLAGRGAALGGDCTRGEARLREYLVTPQATGRARELAEVALGACELVDGRVREARVRLAPLTAAKDDDVRTLASLWLARVAIQLGDNAEAARLLQAVDPGLAQWELAAASLDAGQWVQAESLLTQRAIRGDWRQGATTAITQLWAAGQDSAVLRLARRWARAGTPVAAKVRMHLQIGDLALASGRDSLAGEHLREARRLSTDASIDQQSEARLLLVRVAEADSLTAIEEVIRQSERVGVNSPTWLRLRDNVLLTKLLVERGRDGFGTGLFLAAEVVRDSLRNRRVAHDLFRRVSDEPESARSPMAASALLAAALLAPDSAEAYRERVRREHPETPAAYILAGRDAAELPTWQFMAEQFRARWTVITRQHRDSVSKLRPTGVPGAAPIPGTQQPDARLGQAP